MDDPSISNQDKIGYLKEVGAILRKMETARKYTSATDFYLNDMHEGNFVLNKETLKINTVDLDSASINGNMPFASKYLSPNCSISSFEPKYRRSNLPCTGIYYSDQNSDIYCYVMMILNYLLGCETYRLPLNVFYDYMNYLKQIGFSNELVDIFAKVFTFSENENPDYLLDQMEPFVGKANRYVFGKKSGYTFR